MKFQVTLRNLFTLTLSVAFAVLDVQLWSRFKHLVHDNSAGIEAQEKLRLENKLGYLSAPSSSASYYVGVPAFEPMTFVTRIYIAKDHRVKSLILSTNPKGANMLQWNQWEKSVVFPIDWIGYHTVTVQVNKQIDGKWNTTIQNGDTKWEIPLDREFTDFLEPGDYWSRNFWKQDFLGVNPRLSPSAIKLLAIDAAPVSELHKSFNPTNGLHVWVE